MTPSISPRDGALIPMTSETGDPGVDIGHVEGLVCIEIGGTELCHHEVTVDGGDATAHSDVYIEDPDDAREIADEIRRQADQAERWRAEENE